MQEAMTGDNGHELARAARFNFEVMLKKEDPI
jgi:hypothetical protein